ncbi:MAG: insulinase family protein [Elusimicrobiota bacterium]|jgi:predicted Zn-dependent peptidase|nr:insulinase family protein [Elusimicrobiota bacterium]
MKKIILIIIAQILFAQIAAADIKTFTLSNKIKVIFEKTDKREIVSLKVFTPVSSISENKKNYGISYLTFKAMTNSTLKRNKEKLANDLDDIGASISGDAKLQYAYLGVNVLSQNFDKAAEILSDVIINPAFRVSEIRAAKEEILLDLSLRKDNAALFALDNFMSVFYRGSAPAYPNLGTVKTIKALKISDIKRWHKYSYNSQNIIISAAGNIDEEILKNSLEKHFSKIKSGQKFKQNAVKIAKSKKRFFYFKSKFNSAVIVIGYGAPGLNSKELPAFDLLTVILGDGLNGKLAKEIRVNSGLTYNINMFYSLMRQKNSAMILSLTDSKNVKKTLKKIDEILKEMSSKKAESGDLERAKIKEKADFLFNAQTVDEKSFNNGWGETVAGSFKYKTDFLNSISEVSLEDILKSAEKTFKQKPVVIIMTPSKSRK